MAESFGQTILNGAKLQGAYLEGATLPDEKYLVAVDRWPDGERYRNVEDLKRFTDQNHELFDKTLQKIDRIREAHFHVGESKSFSVRD